MIEFSIRLQLYDNPARPDGYRGSLTREGFTALSLPQRGDRLISVGGFCWGSPFPAVDHVEHLIDHLADVEAPPGHDTFVWADLDGPRATVVAFAESAHGLQARPAYEAQGWSWHPPR